MIKGIYTSAAAMRSGVLKEEFTSNNLANANTTGYKRDRMFVQDLVKATRMESKTEPVPVQASKWTEFDAGAFNPTASPMDFALQGKGFFVVNDGTEEVYTRNGHFLRNSQGQLVDSLGRQVMGEGGAITLPQGDLTTSPNGDISVNGTRIDRLRVVSFENPQSLQKSEGSAFKRTSASIESTVDLPMIRQGFLESSNVDVVREMVEMISTAREYETNAKMLTVQDDTLRHTVNDLARI